MKAVARRIGKVTRNEKSDGLELVPIKLRSIATVLDTMTLMIWKLLGSQIFSSQGVCFQNLGSGPGIWISNHNRRTSINDTAEDSTKLYNARRFW